MIFHPRRWLDGIFSYSRYMGYIKPRLISDTEEEYNVRRKILSKAWEARRLVAPVADRILVISPHADDESIGAGGLLWAHRNISEIHLVALTLGEKGGALAEKIEDGIVFESRMAEERKKEFAKIAALLNAKSCRNLGFKEGEISFTDKTISELRELAEDIKPDVILLPWFLDDRIDHRHANILYARACQDLEVMVFGYEVWSPLDANAFLDITQYLNGKISLINNYQTQLRTVDYINYIKGLARVRAFQHQINSDRSGSVEAYLALPNHEYCELVRLLYDKEFSSR